MGEVGSIAKIKLAEYQWLALPKGPGGGDLTQRYRLQIYESCMELNEDGLYCFDLLTTSFGMYPLFANRTYHMANRASALYMKHQKYHRWWFPEEEPPDLPPILYV